MISSPYKTFAGIAIASLFLFSCQQKPTDTLFTELSSDASGIHFSNDITETDSTHSFINEFGYMGGGVGIGDFNNDGLKDIFFSGNQVSCRAYINKGDNKFEDITEKAGLTTNIWATGVSIVDINNDGYDDIYVCAYGKNLLTRDKNLLFINQHDLTFKEEAEAYGLADLGYSTQAAFFDYDRDGDLDMFLVNYLFSTNNINNIVPIDRTGHSQANDKLYRNDGDSAHTGHPVFKDVTVAAGIRESSLGLGVTISDLNNDGWPDVYVANDFISNDELWINNHDGTFFNSIDRSMRHQSYSSMGADAADINNDGLPDVMTLDMLPEDNKRKKTAFFFMNYERYQAERNMGYEPEFMRNMLQLNNGSYSSGDTSIPYFSEIGQLAGVAATDWSWSVLLADFNNDGWKDIHVTNGIGRDFIDGDFLEFSSQVFSGSQTREEQEKAIRERLASRKHVTLANYLYLNNHDYTFADASEKGGINEPSMSNGAAYADLDNDGDLDLVVNNISKEAFVFLNTTNQKDKPATAHYLTVKLKGDKLNTHGFGARVTIYTEGHEQVQEQSPVRGYFSSVDQQLLFGLGKYSKVDSLIVLWPDAKKQTLLNIAADTVKELVWTESISNQPSGYQTTATLFADITSGNGIAYRHHDNSFNDFAYQRLLQQKYSQLGPFITTGDINNDGATDFFIGNGFNFSGAVFTQQKNQSFTGKNLVDSAKLQEDMDCLLFDADGDGDQDLVVTNGDILFDDGSVNYQPRLYMNDGKGNFSLSAGIPATVSTIAGAVAAGDYDGDGDLDLFIGGRVSKKYPVAPHSFLLQNNKGVFTDVTAKVCPALQQAGMITSAVWTDFDNDKQVDLVIAGDWMPVQFYKNNKGSLQDVTAATGLTNINGMWRSLIAADIDNDGDMDLVAGNLGLNCLYKVSAQYPMQVMASDIDGNGSIDPVFFYYIKEKVNGERHSYPGIGRSQFAEQVPAIKKTFLRYEDYSSATADDIFKGKAKDNLLQLHCDETQSCFFENQGNGKFRKVPLPMEAQFAPVNAIICDDIDGDGIKDLVLAGNEYQADVMTGRYDASYGCFLKGGAKNIFTAIPSRLSGLRLNGDIKDLALINLPDNKKIILAAVNNDSLRVFSIR